MSHQDHTFTPFDLWAMGQVVGAKPSEVTITRVSPQWRSMIERLRAEPDDSGQRLEEALMAIPGINFDDMNFVHQKVMAIATADTDSPPPDEDFWPLLTTATDVPVRPFPVEVLPEPVQGLVRTAAKSIGCPEDYLGMAALAVGGAAVGRAVSLKLKDGYNVFPSFYIAIVDRPGSGKTPALDNVVEPLRQLDRQFIQKFEVALAEYKRACDDRDAQRRTTIAAPSKRLTMAQRKADAEADAMLNASDDDQGAVASEAGPIAPEPIRPTLRRCVTAEYTAEALAGILTANPRGVSICRDELSGLMASMNQYRNGRGSDRQDLLSFWSGQETTIDRKGNTDGIPIMVPACFLSIIGGIQPEVLDTLREAKGRDDGFLDRFLFVYPDPLPKEAEWEEEGIPDSVKGPWTNMVERLMGLMYPSGSGPACGLMLGFSPQAREAWRAFIGRHRTEQNDADFPDSLRGPWQKFEEYAGRIVLALHMLDWAAQPGPSAGPTPLVGPETVEDAIKVIDYLKQHTRKARAVITHADKKSAAILDWIAREQRPTFSLRDAYRGVSMDSGPCELALSLLAANNYVRPLPPPARAPGQDGRKPSPRYETNPHFLEGC